VQALSSVVGVCHGNLRVASDTVQMEREKNTTEVPEEGQHRCCGPQKGHTQLYHLTEVSYMLSGPSTVTSFIMSSPGTSLIFLTLPELHPRPPLSCQTQRNHLEGDLSRATTHVQLLLHTSALSFFLITFTLFR
jgi:hypothetical protein